MPTCYACDDTGFWASQDGARRVRCRNPKCPCFREILCDADERTPLPGPTHPSPASAATPPRKVMSSTVALAINSGYTGDCCDKCGSFSMRRSGACLVCDACGASGGCG